MHCISPKTKRVELAARCVALAKPLRQHGSAGGCAARSRTMRYGRRQSALCLAPTGTCYALVGGNDRYELTS